MKKKPKIDDRVIFNEIIPQRARIKNITSLGYELKLDDGRNIWVARGDFIFEKLRKK